MDNVNRKVILNSRLDSLMEVLNIFAISFHRSFSPSKTIFSLAHFLPHHIGLDARCVQQ